MHAAFVQRDIDDEIVTKFLRKIHIDLVVKSVYNTDEAFSQ